ncbi:MAG: cohesin domain-containing protein [Luteibaculum sp.]
MKKILPPAQSMFWSGNLTSKVLLVFLLTGLFSASKVKAQENCQLLNSPTFNSFSAPINFQQSFTADCTANLHTVAVHAGAAGGRSPQPLGVLKIYEGEGTTGTLLYQATGLMNLLGDYVHNLSSSLVLTEGNVYTLSIYDPQGSNSTRYKGNSYPGGKLYIDGVETDFDIPFDLRFGPQINVPLNIEKFKFFAEDNQYTCIRAQNLAYQNVLWNGKPLYFSTSGVLKWDGNRWEHGPLLEREDFETTYWYSEFDTPLPPCSGWKEGVSGGCSSGLIESLVAVSGCSNPDDEDPIPSIYSGNIDALANQSIIIPVTIAGFQDFQTLQGNVDFGTGALALIDSVKSTEVLSDISGVDGSYHVIDNRLTYSYDNVEGNFSIADGSVLFYVYGHLVNTNQDDLCFTPFANEEATPHQFGRMVDGLPEITIPEVSFEQVCVSGGASVPNTFEFGDYAIPCPGSNLIIPVSYSGYFDSNADFIVRVDGNDVTSFPVGQFEFQIDAGILVGGINNIQVVHQLADFSVGHELAIDAYDTPELLVFEEEFDPEINQCPDYPLELTVVTDQDIIWRYSTDGGNNYSENANNKEFSVSSEGSNTVIVQVQVYNAAGCLSEEVHEFSISVQDIIAPSISLVKSYYPVWGLEEFSLHVDDLIIEEISDNCTDSESLILSFKEQGSSMIFTEANTVVEVEVRDASGNVSSTLLEVEMFDLPALSLKQKDYLSTYYSKGTNEEAIRVAAVGETPALYSRLSGSIDFGALFTGTGVVSLENTLPSALGEMSLSNEGSTVFFDIEFNRETQDEFSTAMNNSQSFDAAVEELNLLLSSGIFRVRFQPNLIITGRDSLIQPAAGESSFVIMGTESQATVNFEEGENTLEGISRFTVELHTEDDLVFDLPTEVSCASCLSDGSQFETVLNINGLNTQLSFLTLSTNPVSITFVDNSGHSFQIGTEDVIANRQYIINSREFSMEQLAKADVDNNGDINTLDVLQMRENIVGDRPSFVNAYGQSSPYNYLWVENGSYKKVENYSLAGIKLKSFDFKVFQMGNLYDEQSKLKSSDLEMALQVGSVSSKPGEQILVPVIANKFDAVAGYQFTVNWDNSMLDYIGVESASTPVMVGESRSAEGSIGVSWIENKASNASLVSGDTLFFLVFETLSTVSNQSSCDISISSDQTPAAAYDQDLRAQQVKATSGKVSFSVTSLIDLGNGYGIGNPTPNPMLGDCSIKLQLPVDQELTFTLYNNSGQLVSQTLFFTQGIHEHEIKGLDNLSSGMYILIVSGTGIQHSAKIVKM